MTSLTIAGALEESRRERQQSTPAPIRIAAAVELARLGYFVVPVLRSNKRPPFETGPGHATAATRDPEQIAAWFEANLWEIALVLHLSGHVAIDVDIKPPRQAQTIAWFRKLEAIAGGFVGRTASQRTPSGGWHYLFREPSGVDLRSQLAPTIELQRHILVVAPSCGRRWIRHPATGVLPFPEPLIPRARRRTGEPLSAHRRRQASSSQASIHGLIRTVESAYDGNRNRTLYWAACRLHEREHADTDESDLIFAAAASGLPLDEAIRTVESARRMVGNPYSGRSPEANPPIAGNDSREVRS